MRGANKVKRVNRRIRWPRLLLVLLVLILISAVVIGAGFYAFLVFGDRLPGAINNAKDELGNARINILLLGVDDESSDLSGVLKPATTVIIASSNPRSGATNFLFVPINTQVEIPGRKGYDRLADAPTYGGQALTKLTIEQLLNIHLNYYLIAKWQGLIKAVDILGGIDLYVERDMNYDDPKGQSSIHLTKGYQHLDGLKAGQYIHFGNDDLGDLGRVQRQQRFLMALGDALLRWGTLFKLPALTLTWLHSGTSDIPPAFMFKAFHSIKVAGTSVFRSELLPGKFVTTRGINFWVPDKSQTKQMVDELFRK